MSQDIVFRERYGSKGNFNKYFAEENKLTLLHSSGSVVVPKYNSYFKNFFRQVFLPHGYPESVSDDYLHYQVWDTIQAFFSTITGTLTTQSIMIGIGVGNKTATAFGAAITWIMKDGTGMIGRIAFAWWKGSQFDSDCKKWRLFADLLNDTAMCIELMVPSFLPYATPILCVSTAMKSLVGVAGGATRAALTQHQAIRDNMADVSAKDGSQETCVNLLASVFGIFILATFDEGEYVWPLFIFFAACHLFANFRAVRALRMVTLNQSRYTILLQTYLMSEAVGSTEQINLREPVFLGSGRSVRNLCGFDIELGASLHGPPGDRTVPVDELQLLGRFYRHRDYLLCIHLERRTIAVLLSPEAAATDVLQAFYHAVLLGIALCMITEIPLPILSKKRVTVASYPAKRLRNALIKYCSRKAAHKQSVAFEAMLAADEIITREFPDFLQSLTKQGWSTMSHHLAVNEWRADWSRDHMDTVTSSSNPVSTAQSMEQQSSHRSSRHEHVS